MAKKNIFLINLLVLLVSVMLIVSYLFFYNPEKIPLVMFTPITGILGIVCAFFLEKNTLSKKVFLGISIVVTLIVPIYMVLIMITPDIFV